MRNKFLRLFICLVACLSVFASSVRKLSQSSVQVSKVEQSNEELLSADSLQQQGSHFAAVVVVVRQKLFDYATEVGVKYLEQDVTKLVLPAFYRRKTIPFLGTIKVYVHNLTIPTLTIDQSNTDILIKGDQFDIAVSNLETKIDFLWSYRVACISGQGHGSLLLKRGSLNMKLGLTSEGENTSPYMVVNSTNTQFDQVQIQMEADQSNWFYQTLLGLSQNWIDNQIVSGINRALQRDFPSAINQVLKALPNNMSVSGIPLQIHVRYAVETENFFAAEAYDTVTATASESERTQSQSSIDSDDAVCPFNTSPLELTPKEMAEDPHMMTIFGHDSVLNCLLWGLQRYNKLDTVIRQGDISGLNLLTILFQRFIIGIQEKYPFKFMQFDIHQAQQPQITFQSGSRPIQVNSQFYQDIYVVKEGEIAQSPDELQYICRLFGNITLELDIQWDAVHVDDSDIHAYYEVVDSPEFEINTDAFAGTIQWLVMQSGEIGQLAFGSIIDTYVENKFFSQDVNVKNSIVQGYEEGWLGVSADMGLDQTFFVDYLLRQKYGGVQGAETNLQSTSNMFDVKDQANLFDLGALISRAIANQGHRRNTQEY